MSRALEGPASPGWGAEPAPCGGRERFRTHSTNRDRMCSWPLQRLRARPPAPLTGRASPLPDGAREPVSVCVSG